MSAQRRARIVGNPPSSVEAYLPGNYRVERCDGNEVWIVGEDVAGWTLDGYVLPRLASGLHFGKEIDG